MSSYYKYSTNLGDRTYFTSTIVNSNGNQKRYFSNIESEIYFGNKRMDDINQFSFGIDEKVLPLYGYNCFYPSEIVSGQRIIQGQFIINFTDRGVIQDTLNSIEDSIYTSKYTKGYCPGGDRDHAIWDKNFDIMLGYGYYGLDVETYNATCQSIIGAKITGMQKVMDTSGQPLLEVYNFVAKDFIEEEITQVNSDNNSNKQNETSDSKLPNDLKYVCSDHYNANQIMSNRNYCANNSNCLHLIHNLTFSSSANVITAHIIEDNGKSVNIESGSLNITEQYESNTVLPVFKFNSTSKAIGTIDVKKIYCDVLENLKKQGYERLKCTLNYQANINGTSMNISFKDAYVYI